MAKAHAGKIIVLRRESYQGVHDRSLATPKAGTCDLFYAGQGIVVGGDDFRKMPHDGFCPEAWDCVSRYVMRCCTASL